MINPLRLLLAEDSESDEKLIVHELRRGLGPIDHVRVEDAESMRQSLADKEWDLILSDWTMPRFTALDALDVHRSSGLDLPFIVVSGSVGEESAAEAMRAGAHDFVLKDRLRRLAPAVQRELAGYWSRRARRALDERLYQRQLGLSRLMSSGVLGVVVADLEGDVHEANEAYLEMIGHVGARSLGGLAPWGAITPAEWRPGDEAVVAQLRAGRTVPAWQKELRCRDGSRLPVLVGAAMMNTRQCVAFVVDLRSRYRLL